MPVSVGTRLGPYEVLAPLGAGGMGEVYKARDTKLDRMVAVKVLPAAFARDPDRLARFEREAKVLASLNHPNIAQIYGLEESDGVRALVMELVPGAPLQGPLPLDTALHYARQIADALEAAHEKGITHRDLKPANIMITPEGPSQESKVKVLDFGLAAFPARTRDASGNPSDSPTLTMSPTHAGMILGTAAYMSPEQASGKVVDKRADIWSFGVVLWEMLTGEQLFRGETVSHILASVLKDEPDLTRVPERARRLLRRCLEKDPKKRLRDIGDAWSLLDDERPSADAQASPRRRTWLWPAVAALAVIAAVSIGGYTFTRPAPSPLTTRFNLLPPPGSQFTNAFAAVAISPDGRFVVFGAASGANSIALWLRPLDSLEARLLPGTENGNLPFWSPDSKSVGFAAGGKLKRVDIAGGAPLVLCDSPGGGNASVGGSWNSDGVILFGGAEGLYRIPASGGTPALLTKASLTKASGDTAHGFPQFLPDGKRFLYFAESQDPNVQGVYASSLDRPQERKLIVRTAAKALYTPPLDGRPGYLLWMRERTLLAQRFDAGNLRLEGDPTPLAEDIALAGRRAAVWTSTAGLVGYRVSSGGTTNLLWIGRDGKRQAIAAPEGAHRYVRLSPDATRLAARRGVIGSADIWLLELARNTWTRFTFDPKADQSPVWSPDGRQIAFSSDRSGQQSQIYRKDSGGGGPEEQLTNGPRGKFPNDWSRDGRYLLYAQSGVAGSSDLWALPLEGERKPTPVFSSPFAEVDGRFSPNGKWIAYVSDESGKNEVYVQTFSASPSAPKGKWQVSVQGGTSPVWRGDGKELFFLAGNKMMAAGVRETASGLEIDTPRELFSTTATPGPGIPYDVTADGQRFLVQEPTAGANDNPLTVIVNWQAGLKQ